jgi:hypothetical protein
MPNFAPRQVSAPYHFDIACSRAGCWTVRERTGLTGGTFVSRKEALRFALFETGGDSAQIHLSPETPHRRQRVAGRKAITASGIA